MKYHKAHKYILNPQHKVTVCVIGCGGTGSQVLSALARFNTSLIALGHLGLHVVAYDDDIVTEANLGRQLFSEAEIGTYKAVSLITKLNRHYGTSWEAIPKKYTQPDNFNIYITCVDSFEARFSIAKLIRKKVMYPSHYGQKLYWMDFGNTNSSGQMIFGTLFKDKDNVSMPCFDEWAKMYELPAASANTPSCSLAEALEKQDLYINSTLANLGINLLWRLFRKTKTPYRGILLNLDSMLTNPIPV